MSSALAASRHSGSDTCTCPMQRRSTLAQHALPCRDVTRHNTSKGRASTPGSPWLSILLVLGGCVGVERSTELRGVESVGLREADHLFVVVDESTGAEISHSWVAFVGMSDELVSVPMSEARENLLRTSLDMRRGVARVAVGADGYVPFGLWVSAAELERRHGTPPRRVELSRGSVVRGTVRDSSDAPVRDAVVVLGNANGNGWIDFDLMPMDGPKAQGHYWRNIDLLPVLFTHCVARTTTDELGRWTLTCVPGYTLCTVIVVPQVTGLAPTVSHGFDASVGRVTVDVTVSAAGAIRGTVNTDVLTSTEDSSQSYLREIVLQSADGDVEAYCAVDRQGKFSLGQLPVGTYTLSVIGYTSEETEVVVPRLPERVVVEAGVCTEIRIVGRK